MIGLSGSRAVAGTPAGLFLTLKQPVSAGTDGLEDIGAQIHELRPHTVDEHVEVAHRLAVGSAEHLLRKRLERHDTACTRRESAKQVKLTRRQVDRLAADDRAKAGKLQCEIANDQVLYAGLFDVLVALKLANQMPTSNAGNLARRCYTAMTGQLRACFSVGHEAQRFAHSW